MEEESDDITKNRSTITLTFGDQAENHVGMQKIGKMASDGFSIDDLLEAKKTFEKSDIQCEFIQLNDLTEKETEPAALLIIRDGVKVLLSDNSTSDDLFNEQSQLELDKKAFMYGRVVQKNARYNLCFSKESQEPDYENGKGRIVAFDEVPLLEQIRQNLPKFLGEKANDLMVEGNYYHDVKKCGIGFHGDAERRRVVGLRLGCSLPLHFQWFFESKPIGKRAEFIFSHGDLYVMSEKTTGFDWKMRKKMTLRHAAGAQKYLQIKTKKRKNEDDSKKEKKKLITKKKK